MSKPNELMKTYWRSLQPKKRKLNVLGNDEGAGSRAEFPPGADELEIAPGASRRKFMGILGASAALAGVTGCVRKPVEHILPYAKRPEDLIPGNPTYYATAFQVGATVMGLLVESQDGRPTKIEGNPQHSGSLGGTDIWAQASVLGLYDPDRSTAPMSTTQAAYAVAADADTAKKAATEVLCDAVKDRVLADSKSLDRAVEARADCEARIEKGGKWQVENTPEGVQAAVRVDGDSQVDSDWNTAWLSLDDLAKEMAKGQGDGVALVIGPTMSPTLRAQIRAFQERNPKARVFLDDPGSTQNAVEAAEALGGPGTRFYYQLADARVIVSADSDFLGHEQDHVRLTREYADGRKLENPRDQMNRLYAMGPNMTQTAAQADNRLNIKSGQVADVLMGIAHELLETHQMKHPGGSEPLKDAIKKPKLGDAEAKYVAAVAKDLADNKGKALVLVGDRQPAAVHGLGMFINMTLRALGGGPAPSLMRSRTDADATAYGRLEELAVALDDGKVSTVICLGTNPAYDAPGSLAMGERLAKAKVLVHAGEYRDETGQIAHWHLPTAHFLESWGDLEAVDGTTSIQQPLIAPLHGSPSLIELVARLANPGEEADGLALVRKFWDGEVGAAGVPERRWRRWLHDGVVSGIPRTPTRPKNRGWGELQKGVEALPKATDRVEVQIDLDSKVLGGEYSNNGWLQELPDSATKLTWDNAALISRKMANDLGVENGDMVDVKIGDASVTLPAWVSPGQHPETVALRLGYGRRGLGAVAEGSGFDVYKLQDHTQPHFAPGDIGRGAGKYQLISTQDHGALDPDDSPTFLVDPPGGGLGIDYPERELYRETDRRGYKQNPKFAKEGDLMPPGRLKSLWDRPELTRPDAVGDGHRPQQLHGVQHLHRRLQLREQHPGGRQGDGGDGPGDALDSHRPLLPRRPGQSRRWSLFARATVMQCENGALRRRSAPSRRPPRSSAEGLNDMAYNRCVGTRYCSQQLPLQGPAVQLQVNYNLDIRAAIEKLHF